MTPERIERALREVTREARTEQLPHVDWARIEDELPMTRVHTVPPRPLSVRPWLIAASFALTGALGAYAVTLVHPHAAPVAAARVTTPSSAAARASANGDVNGDALAVGAHVVAGDVPQSVVHAGHARWTLAPHSEGTLLANGDIVTVRLDRGSVTSRVVKSSRTETFAVEAADVRVAAHGTEFTVSLGADGVSVSVTEGSVLVGPREEPGQGQLLISPAAKRYTHAGLPIEDDSGLEALGGRRSPSHVEDGATAADGATGASAAQGRLALEAPASAKKPGARKAANEPEAGDATAASDLDQRPSEPTAAGLEAATTSVMRLTQACFKERTIAGEGVRVTAQTSVTFRTLPEGGVNRVVFEPPLSPAVQACVNAGMSAIQTEGTRNGFQVSRSIDLER
ncbi:MAG TPA: FecR domain-containing protein [Polyangiaceae bacterium]|nr:FecR domain-containing protein [Polyangiaceae bacterium]